ncbi:MAG: hypothetical protein R3F20_03125 [Planctomycetota bacterium]
MIVAPPRTALAVLVLASLALSSGGLLAQAVPQSALAPTERDLVRGAAVLAKRAVGPVRSATLPAYFGTGPSQAQYDAQFGEPFTVGELLGHLPRMVDNGKIRVDSIRARTRTYLAQGQDADTIVVASRLLDRASTGSAGLPAAYWGLTLAAALATEVTHVFQIPLLGAASQCDAARDADGLGLLVLDGFLAALRAPGGTPHASFAAMDADGDAIVGLTAFLGSGGVADAPGDIAALAEALARRRKGRALRRTLALGDPAWTSSYYGSGAQSGLDDAAATDAATRAKSTMTDVSGLVVRDLVVPAPGLLTQTTVFLNDLDETVAISAYFDAGAHHLRFWRDTDGDGLPEAAPAATDVTLPGAFSDPGLHGVSLHPTLPPALTNAGTDRGLLLHDRASGAVFALELGVDGLPAAAPLALFSHVKFTDAQGFVHLNHVTSVGTADIGFVFSSQPIVADAGANQATRIVLVGPNPTTGAVPPRR